MRRGFLAAIAIFLAAGVYCAATKPIMLPPEKEIEFLTQLIAEEPNRGDRYQMRAMAYNRLGDRKKAISDLTKALELGTGAKWLTYFKRANTYKAIGDYEKALADFARGFAACHSCDGFADEYMSRGEIYVALERYDLAIKDYKTAIQEGSYLPEPYRALANVYVKLGDYAAAIKCYGDEIEYALKDASWRVFPVSPYAKRGELYELIGEREKAIADYDKAIADLKQICDGGFNNPPCAELKRLQSLRGE
ncbi:MAG: tetratricopeptide repeat protein [Helicobacteraceae bacterium]|jgi:tetratricopeptide (TPR) repeat protein|nr:tetratricopeptide repeat protein [Helicobacteraceae bacterium]